MRERVTVVSVSQSVSHFFILEKAPFSGLKLTSVHSRRRFKSFNSLPGMVGQCDPVAMTAFDLTVTI